MSELPNLVWVYPPTETQMDIGGVGKWSEKPWPSEKFWGVPYTPASELEQAQDMLAECGEEMARMRNALTGIMRGAKHGSHAKLTAAAALGLIGDDGLIREKPHDH